MTLGPSDPAVKNRRQKTTLVGGFFYFISLLCFGYRSGRSHRLLLRRRRPCTYRWVSPALRAVPASTEGRFGCLLSCSVSLFSQDIPGGCTGRSHHSRAELVWQAASSQHSTAASLRRRAPVSLPDT